MNKKTTKIKVPSLIEGDAIIDERGEVAFVNGFDFPKIKRFYMVSNNNAGEVRAWHGHKYEAKYVYAISGSALVAAIAIDNWKNPSKENKVHQFILSSKKPAVLYIPEGYVNGFKSLTKDARLMFFSTSTLEESKKDDIRFDPIYWNIWD
jgi:dTDP-4-dehydrorhamnose 3,5-epimerase-like enzyme